MDRLNLLLDQAERALGTLEEAPIHARLPAHAALIGGLLAELRRALAA